MQINIGENIRRLRLARGMTQEQLSEVFGVSPQAVSRWENGSACPDVTMLPGIAMFFDTTADDILGMAQIRSDENLNRIHGEINAFMEAGDPEGAAALIRESLRLYPDNAGLLMSLAETLAHVAGDAALEEAIEIEERILRRSDVSMKAKSTSAVNLMYLYIRAGRDDDARRVIKSLPHIWESREMLMPEPFRGAEYEEELKKAVRKALVYLCMRIDRAKNREPEKIPEYVQLGVDFTPDMPDIEMLRKIEKFLG